MQNNGQQQQKLLQIGKQRQQQIFPAEAAALPDEEGQRTMATKRRSVAELRKRARRCTIRMASMGNRCYWMSTAEVASYIATGGDMLRTHANYRLFTRQLQWAFFEPASACACLHC